MGKIPKLESSQIAKTLPRRAKETWMQKTANWLNDEGSLPGASSIARTPLPLIDVALGGLTIVTGTWNSFRSGNPSISSKSKAAGWLGTLAPGALLGFFNYVALSYPQSNVAKKTNGTKKVEGPSPVEEPVDLNEEKQRELIRNIMLKFTKNNSGKSPQCPFYLDELFIELFKDNRVAWNGIGLKSLEKISVGVLEDKKNGYFYFQSKPVTKISQKDWFQIQEGEKIYGLRLGLKEKHFNQNKDKSWFFSTLHDMEVTLLVKDPDSEEFTALSPKVGRVVDLIEDGLIPEGWFPPTKTALRYVEVVESDGMMTSRYASR